jgi:predicted nucleic acid-binding protein
VTIIDTDILIDAGRGIQAAVERLNAIAASTIPTISVITQMELIVGCRNKSELQKLAKFLE